MIVFALYAACVWYLALRYRRHWAGFAISIAAALGVALLTKVLPAWMERPGFIPMSILLWGEAAMVGGIGLFIASLGRTPASTLPCPRCGYDLRGLPAATPVCPECGTGILPGAGHARPRTRASTPPRSSGTPTSS